MCIRDSNNILAFGDLLHTIHPLAGQGFNMTIRDVKILLNIIKNKVEVGLPLDKSINIEGGISGKPLLNKSNNLIKAIKDQVGGKIKIIGTGGITTKESAIYKLDCGADLIQMYTGLVYKGTNLIREITTNIK